MNVLNSYFDKVYVITSKSTENRVSYIRDLFDKEQITFDFHYGPHYDFVNDSVIQGYLDWLKGRGQEDSLPSNKFRISCAISHLQVLRQFQHSKFNNVLIFEDDVCFEHNYVDKIKLFMENLPSDWDIVNLGRNYSYNDDQIIKVNEYISRPKTLYGAHAYAFSRNKISEFCDYFENPHQLPWGPDPHYVKMYNSGYNCYCPNDFIFGALSIHQRDKNFIKTNECFKSDLS
jgi:GR25 family glycosyltransferase involved in LPS biosynthesis